MLSYVSLNSNRPQAVMATGQVLFHRFYCKKSFARFGVKVLRHYKFITHTIILFVTLREDNHMECFNMLKNICHVFRLLNILNCDYLQIANWHSHSGMLIAE